MARYCASCGTEVDDTAAFCPTCGQPLDDTSQVELPPAPEWPEQPAGEAHVADEAPTLHAASDQPHEPAAASEPWRAAGEPAPNLPPPITAPGVPSPPPPAPSAMNPPAGEPPEATALPRGRPPVPSQPEPAPSRPSPAGTGVNVPITWPVMLSGWLIGGGAAVGALGAAVGLFSPPVNAWDVIFLLAFVGIAYTVFFAPSAPAIPHLRLITMVVVLIGFGMALDRLGFGVGQLGSVLLLLGTAAAAIGVILIELGRDQPLGGPRAGG